MIPGLNIPTWAPGTSYQVGYAVQYQGAVWVAKSAHAAGATFSGTTNWQPVSDREHILRAGTQSFRDTYDARSPVTTLTPTSGTEIGATVAALAGESYGHALFFTSTTAATFGSNNDGHWYIAVYDDAGNLVTQTADQGITAIGASGAQRKALGATITPAKDALYTVVAMIYVGTGGSPVMPTLKAVSGLTTSTLVPGVGMPNLAITANAGQTSGTAPGTLGSIGNPASIPYLALYS